MPSLLGPHVIGSPAEEGKDNGLCDPRTWECSLLGETEKSWSKKSYWSAANFTSEQKRAPSIYKELWMSHSHVKAQWLSKYHKVFIKWFWFLLIHEKQTASFITIPTTQRKGGTMWPRQGAVWQMSFQRFHWKCSWENNSYNSPKNKKEQVSKPGWFHCLVSYAHPPMCTGILNWDGSVFPPHLGVDNWCRRKTYLHSPTCFSPGQEGDVISYQQGGLVILCKHPELAQRHCLSQPPHVLSHVFLICM